MQSIARDSDESSDDEFFDAHGVWAPWSTQAFLERKGWDLKGLVGMQVTMGITHGKFWVNSRASGAGAG